MTLDKNTSPYYNDFDETKKYYEILFRPGYAVQARELSQLQTTLQNQIKRFGSHVFKEGAMVIPGETGLDTKLSYVKLEDQFNSTDINIENFRDKTVIGTTSGTRAKVIEVAETLDGDPNTLFVNYEAGQSSQSFTASISNGSATVTGISIDATDKIIVGALVTGTGIPANTYIKQIVSTSSFIMSAQATATNASASLTVTTSDTFVEGETLVTLETIPYSAVVTDDSNGNTGYGSRVQIQQGVYFALGYFCFVETQTLILDKYSNVPSYKVGLRIVDEFVSSADDSSLVDPAAGSPNFNAPGANRYKITLTLSKFELDEDVTDNFIELIRVKNGIVQKLVDRTEYSELEKTFARRTYDESGDYTVRAFPLRVREHLNDGSNLGVYSESDDGDEAKMVYAVEPGKAYVKGYEIESRQTILLDAAKARTNSLVNGQIIPFALGNYIDITNVDGTFDISTYSKVDLQSIDKSDSNYPGSIIGTARVRGMEFISGTPGGINAIYRLWLFDIQMEEDSDGNKLNFADVKSVYLSATVNADCVQVTNETVLYNSTTSSALIRLPNSAIKTLKDEFDSVDNWVTVKRYQTGAMSGNSLTLTAGTSEIYSSYSATNYHVSVVSASGTALGNGVGNGDIINLSAGGNSVVLGGSPTGKQAVITIPSIAGSTIAVIATLTKSTITEKTKTLATRTQTLAHANSIQLDKADIFDIVSIVTDDSDSTDITNLYILDNGQRDNFYDRGKLIFKQQYPEPLSTNVIIQYRYFNHGAGDFFSVDSYSGVIDYNEIPTYNSQSTGAIYDLKNVLDFRPRVNDGGTEFSVTSEIVASGENFVLDYFYYLPRTDKIFLDSFGNFRVITGVPSDNPVSPNTPVDGMVIYEVYVPAYTNDLSQVVLKQIDNKRYTMRDIGKIEKRVENLEYYTSLSLLEKETADLFIDDGTGQNRFKNGFLVDNFTSHLIGDGELPEYACSIDGTNGILRPSFISDSVPVSLVTGESSNYVKTGDLITLPYTTEVFISQPFASTTENVNPYNVFNWAGNLVLTPESDEWYETEQAPDRIIVNDDGLADSLAALNGQTLWNDWEVSWIGSPLAVQEISRTTRNEWQNVKGRQLRQTSTINQLVTSEQGQTRAGVRFSVVDTTTTQNLGDRVIATTTIPWVREKEIVFSCKALKPNTRVYPFFDETPVSEFCTPTGGSLGGALITNNNGEVSGTFAIPNTESLKFRTGERIFKLVDSQTNDNNFTTTVAIAPYTARGILQTQETTILSTRSAQLVTTAVTDSRTTVGTSTRTITSSTGWYDPLAQTFLIDSEGGAFLSKIDLYFATKDTKGIPVTIQIRTVVNGYPGPHVVPFSTVTINPESVNVSTTGQTSTSFVFPSPVCLEHNQEYCFVILSNSNEYTIWTSEIGKTDVFSGERISQQPYAGVMFKSQNASTWTADQEKDIKFDIHRCVFSTNVTGSVVFKNVAPGAKKLEFDPFITEDGEATVTVYHKNHGLRDTDLTTISGVVGTQNGIPAAELNGSHTINLIDTDYYEITVTTDATATGVTGGDTVYATKNIRADIISTVIESITFPQSSLSFGIKVRDENENLHSDYLSITTKTNVEFTDERFIYNSQNEPVGKSAVLRGQFTTTNRYISPVIDVQRASLIVISNRINNDSTNETMARSGNALARYITKKISLKTPGTAARVYFAAMRPPSSEIKVYIKYQSDADKTTAFDDLPYTELTAAEYPQGSEYEFRDYVFAIEELQPFSIFAIKIVKLSEETSDVPQIRDFRTVATGT